MEILEIIARCFLWKSLESHLVVFLFNLLKITAITQNCEIKRNHMALFFVDYSKLQPVSFPLELLEITARCFLLKNTRNYTAMCFHKNTRNNSLLLF